jgi:uncharacterized tellurite resistance protein B-like protein
MIDAFKSFFSARMAQPDDPVDEESGPPRIHVAACALLLELAYADDEFSDTERAHLETTIQRHFNLDVDTTRELMSLADRERIRAVDLFQFTSLIARHYDEAQKMVLLEAMWGLVFADGVVAKHEKALMRRVSRLLDVRPGFLAEARKRAEA